MYSALLVPALLLLGGCQSAPTSSRVASAPISEPLTTVSVQDAVEIAPAAPIPEPAKTAAPIDSNTAPKSSAAVTLATNLNPVPTMSLGPQPSSTAPITLLATNFNPVNWPANWQNTWLSLEAWGKYNGLPKPILVNTQPAPSFEYHTTNGTFQLKVGSRIAHFDGLECWLGFAPQLIKGFPYIHSADALKSLQALLDPPSFHLKPERLIVLDPGHGGIDSGSKNIYSNKFEKDYTLDWALRLCPLLQANGWRVVLTRTNDVKLPLEDRVALAERLNADLFLSLHFNSGLPNKELAGIETYCLTPQGMPSHLLRVYEDDLKMTFPNNSWDEQNYQIAFRVHRNLIKSAAAPDRGVRRARFMGVLRGQNRPAVLIEGGYLSNPAEAKKIATPAYRQALAESIAKALNTDSALAKGE
jgi:N-acetylmuramoyl-L-alanine amidase